MGTATSKGRLMHVLLIHQAFVSPNDAGGTRHYEFARRMVADGHKVTIIASDLSYLTGKKIATGRGLVIRESLDGITILRAYTFPSLHRSFRWRVVSFLSFMLTSVVAAIRSGPVDIVLGTSPPIFQAVSAWLVSAVKRRPFILEIRDLWPEFAIAMGVLQNSALVWMSRLLERFLYWRACHLIVNSPAYVDYLSAKGLSRSKISLIPNGVDTSMFQSDSQRDQVRRELGLDEKFIVTYAGALGMANDLRTVLRAASRLNGGDTVHFLLVGDGKEATALRQFASDNQLKNVTFLGAQPKSRIPAILSASDVCVAILLDIPMFRTTYPNKVFDYMAAGKPTLLCIDGVIRKVVAECDGGVFCAPGNDEALAAAIDSLRRDPEALKRMGRGARLHVQTHFNRDLQASDFISTLARFSAHKN
jgi:glycosyltransferase involved in cell wall biosynthesis